MKFLLGAAILLASAATAFAGPVLDGHAPSLATGIPAVLAVVCAFGASRFFSRK
jgi:hypothetical protein